MNVQNLPRVLTLLALELAVIKASDPKSHQETCTKFIIHDFFWRKGIHTRISCGCLGFMRSCHIPAG